MKNLNRILAGITCFAIISAVGCSSASKKTEVEHVDTKLDNKAKLGNEQIGVDDKNQAIVQEKIALEDQLRKMKWKNADEEQLLKTNHDTLTRCQKDLANPLLDGNGQMPDIPEVDAAMDTSKVKSSLGLDEGGSLVFVNKELVQDRIAREQKYNDNLVSNNSIVKKHLDKCMFQMGIARQKKGLSASWYYADEKRGYEYEDSLETAFRNAAKDKKRLPTTTE